MVKIINILVLNIFGAENYGKGESWSSATQYFAENPCLPVDPDEGLKGEASGNSDDFSFKNAHLNMDFFFFK